MQKTKKVEVNNMQKSVKILCVYLDTAILERSEITLKNSLFLQVVEIGW